MKKKHSLKDFVTFGRKLVAYGSAPAGKKTRRDATHRDVSTIMRELQIPLSTLPNCKFGRTAHHLLTVSSISSTSKKNSSLQLK